MSDAAQITMIGLVTFGVVLGLVPLFGKFTRSRGITDKPGPGKAHKAPTPYLGGVAIALGAIVCSFVLPEWRGEAALILAGATLVALLGVLDDLRPLGAGLRICVEVVAATAATVAGAHFDWFGTPVDEVFAVVFIVVVTNSFNLLDNMDAAAGTIATTIATTLAVTALLAGQILVGGLAVVVASACLAFLVYNWHPARIFMGDAGSLFLGYLIAVIALKLRPDVSDVAGAATVLLLVGPALFDTTLVVVSRWRTGRSILVGGTDHTSHRLVLLGFRPAEVTALLFLLAVFSCLLGVLVSQEMIEPWAGLVAAGLPGIAAFAVLLRTGTYEADTNDGERTRLVHQDFSTPPVSEAGTPPNNGDARPAHVARSAPETSPTRPPQSP